MAEDIKCVLEHSQWTDDRSVHLVGISMGGFISLELASLLPSQFKSMTLLVTAAKFKKPPKYHWHTEKQLLKYRPGHNIIESIFSPNLAFIEICFSDIDYLNQVNKEGITNKEALTKQLEGMAGNHRPNIYTIFGQSAALRTHNVDNERLREIGKCIPDTVVIGAEEDKLIDPESSNHLAQYLDCKSVIVKGKGHAIIMEGRDEAVNEMIQVFELGNKRWFLYEDFPETDPILTIPSTTKENNAKSIKHFERIGDNHFQSFYLFSTINDYTFKRGHLVDLMNKMSNSKVMHPATRLFRTELVYQTYLKDNLPSLYVYTILARAAQHTFIDNRCVEKFIRRMEMDRIKVDGSHNTYFILGLLENGNFNDALERCTLPNELNISSYYFIEGYLKQGDLNGVRRILTYMEKNSVLLGVATANQILGKLALNFNLELLDHVLLKLEKEGSEWNTGTVRVLHQIYSKYLPDRLPVLEEQTREKYDLEQVKIRNMILESCQRGDLEDIDKKYDLYARAGTIIDPLVMNRIVAMIVNKVDHKPEDTGYLMAKANLYHMRIVQAKQYSYESTYLSLLRMFAETGNYDRTVSLIKQLTRKNFNVSAEHYYYLVDAHCKRGSVIRTKEVIKEMLESKIKPTIKIYNRLIQCYLDQHISGQANPNWAKAFQYLNEIRGCRLPLMPSTTKLFIDTLQKTNNLIQSQKFYEELEKFGDIQDIQIFNHMIKIHNQQKQDYLQEVENYYDLLLVNQVQPDSSTYENMIVAYKKNGDMENCQKMWEEAVAGNNLITPVMVDVMFDVATDANDVAMARTIWDAIRESPVGEACANRYVQILANLDDYKSAKAIYSRIQHPDIKASALMTAKYPELLDNLPQKNPYNWKYLTQNTIPEDSLGSKALHKIQLKIHFENAVIRRESRRRARDVRMDNIQYKRHGRELPNPIDLNQLDEFKTVEDLL
ncbi:hypothetical protein HDV01_004642 [Terramyces sp. JEL0728]|nr:hypothetical protein HDV01_004642 [Terramyces sp. JEL0728]